MIQAIVAWTKLCLKDLKNVCTTYPSPYRTDLRFTAYMAVSEAPIVTTGRLQTINRIFRIRRSAPLFKNRMIGLS